MSNSLFVSVVMTTFNGEKYVIKQLESLYSQSRNPDEVIICDDGSADNTVEIIRNFIETNHLEKWQLHVNYPNLGWKENFYKATGLAKGDIIFFSDQDDIWDKKKIEIMSSLMEKHKMGALFTNKNIIDSEDVFMKDRQEKSHFTGKLSQIDLKPSFYEIKTLGCCMCISRDVANIYQKLAFYKDDHDSQCGRIAVLCSSLWYLDLPLINYRIHSSNSSGISGVASFGQSNKEIRIGSIYLNIEWIEKVKNLLEISPDKKIMLDGCMTFLKHRLDYFEGKTSFLCLLRNYKYYTGLIMLFGDPAYKYNINRKAGRLLWKFKK